MCASNAPFLRRLRDVSPGERDGVRQRGKTARYAYPSVPAAEGPTSRSTLARACKSVRSKRSGVIEIS